MERGGPVESAESRGLTGLRGIGALLVMAHHFYLHLALDLHVPMFQGMLRKGYLGVDLFFVLSGFVLSMVYGSWFDGSRPRSLRLVLTFLVRRVARLWPLHAGILAVLLSLGVWAASVHPTPRLILANFTMIQAWGISAELNPPAWSISTELLAYILFPALAAFVLRGRAGLWLGLICVVAALSACIWLAPPVGLLRRGRLDIYYNYSLLPFTRCLAGFVLGMVTWRVGRLAHIRRLASTAWAGPLALALMFGLMLGRVNDLLIYLTLPLIVLGMHFGRGPVWRAFTVQPLYGLGVLSYSVYLIHFMLLSYFPFGWTSIWGVLAVYFLTTLALAYVAHRLLETPGRLALRAIGDAVIAMLAPLRPVAAPGAPEQLVPAPPLRDDGR